MDEDIRLEEIVELDAAAAPEINSERARQQAEFHAREVRELGELIAAAPAVDHIHDPRQAERQRHHELELLCRELAAAFDWLAAKDRSSRDLDLAMAHLREGYDTAPETVLLRTIAETHYPLLTRITLTRGNGVGLLDETRLSLKHAARGRPLADALSLEQAAALLDGWLAEAGAITPTVPLLPIHQALEWLVHQAKARAVPDRSRPLEDDLEATIYLARGTLEASGLAYRGPEEPAPY
ncbi:hypothetical protein GCM10011611_14780 [Aliidongia dinghuensis]|uniref:Uncharacterized protein n=1 Tax=Aliidongia dinghuensis TaxID=1867774 RepID=A0A8J2YQY4_9PROT|nr:hypothetical protein [Aliidongia dinghuensis]GGF10255.1 hypothetical protein GCM10011611_14780 [Aliidongia dinghuensis]